MTLRSAQISYIGVLFPRLVAKMADETVCIYDVHNEIGLNVDIAHMRAFRDDVPTGPVGPMDVNSALKDVLKNALIHDGLARGLHECAKALGKRQAHLCILANNCDEQMYVMLVEALCNEHGINLLKVEDNKELGEWAGLCKIDKEGKARKVVGCSCVVVKDYGKESLGLDVLNEYFKSKKEF